ncbi:MAG: hypothetical protein J6S49_04130 [Erysipelotrichaceae bacterium]|nr:hypothetical protein [Erysipelotrichaceae bacterium]
MSAIAYITDSKMLELHRLNNHKTMNFWRLSKNTNFSDFSIGDLVFFLSKDKEHRNKREKGIVGFGRMTRITVSSVKTMWDKFDVLNGYQSLAEFKEAILKVSKDKQLPKKISGFYLENVVFFQPVYLSECGMKISTNIESYIYLKEEKVVNKLLCLAKESNDLWSNFGNNHQDIENEQIIYALYASHDHIGDIKVNDKVYRKANKQMKQYIEDNPSYQFVRNSKKEIYKIDMNEISFIFYYDKEIDQRLLIGQDYLYKYYLKSFEDLDVETRFRFLNKNDELSYYLNAI